MTYAFVELRGENAVPVMDQKAIRMIGWDRFAQLLERPLGRRGCRDLAVQDTTGRVFHNDEHIEEAKGRRDDDTEATILAGEVRLGDLHREFGR